MPIRDRFTIIAPPMIIAITASARMTMLTFPTVPAKPQEMLDGLLTRAPEFREMIVQRTPMGRIAQPQEIADVVGFLDEHWAHTTIGEAQSHGDARQTRADHNDSHAGGTRP